MPDRSPPDDNDATPPASTPPDDPRQPSGRPLDGSYGRQVVVPDFDELAEHATRLDVRGPSGSRAIGDFWMGGGSRQPPMVAPHRSRYIFDAAASSPA